VIPPLDDHGYLPPGVHPATLDEIAERFGMQNKIRSAQMDSLRWLADLAWRAGASCLVINGSFTTDKAEPGDVDTVLSFEEGPVADEVAYEELRRGLPDIHLKIADAEEFQEYTRHIFGVDRGNIPKGTAEVIRHAGH
jgi:hypothetical protein